MKFKIRAAGIAFCGECAGTENRAKMDADAKIIDLGVFMGQSNMAGRGNAKEAPRVKKGLGYEYRAITEPERLAELQEPFGVNENNPSGVYEPGMKTGSMVAAFVNACTERTKTPIVAVSCAKGGSAIAQWLPRTAYYQDALDRVRKCKKWLSENGYHIRHAYMVWCQGCTDGDLRTPKAVYRENTSAMLQAFLKEAEMEVCFLIQIGNQRDDPQLYLPIRQAQEEIAAQYGNIVMVSRSFQTFAAKGLMKDRFHYLQEGYNIVGREAGEKAGEYLQQN